MKIKAFTLIELVSVITIIGVLSGVMIYGISDWKNEAYQEKAVSYTNSVKNKIGGSLISEWKMEGTETASIYDSGRLAITGTTSGTLTKVSDCPEGDSCIYSNVANVSFSNIPKFNTVCFWIKPGATSVDILEKTNDLKIYTTLGIVSFRIYHTDTEYTTVNYNGKSIDDDKWHNVCGSLNEDKNFVGIIDGEVITTATVQVGSFGRSSNMCLGCSANSLFYMDDLVLFENPLDRELIALATIVNGTCGTAAKTYDSDETSFGGLDTFCATGNISSIPSFPAAGSSVSWTCNGINSGTSASCIAERSLDGVCGSSDGANVTSAPTTNLCSIGTASAVFGSGPWSWNCEGLSGGATVSCSTGDLPVNGDCGSSDGANLTSAPTTNLCSAGMASLVSGSGPWSWTCDGLYTGTTDFCSANLKVDGVCGSSDGDSFLSAPTTNLCSAGMASLVSGSGPWSWTCDGLYTGTDDSCEANLAYVSTCISGGGLTCTETTYTAANGELRVVNKYTLSGTTTGTTTWQAPNGVSEVDYLVVGGGGGAGGSFGGGGGAGGFLNGFDLSVSAQSSHTVTVGPGGIGGTGANGRGSNGTNSIFSSFTAIGGGGGGAYSGAQVGISGGSGGGGATSETAGSFLAGSGTAGQGFAGGNSYGRLPYVSGGGGGAGAVGQASQPNSGGNGGNGLMSSISGSSVYYAGGGGGAGYTYSNGSGFGLGGLGGGGDATGGNSTNGLAGAANTGGGGGGGGYPNGTGGKGGSGIVIINYVHPSSGACGSSDGVYLASKPTTNLCSNGIASSVSGTNPWTWTCTGDSGVSVSCATTIYLSGFSKRKAITLTNSGSALTNYQVLVTVAYDSDMQADFDDIRFTSSNGITELSYFLDSKTDSSTANFWVKAPSIGQGNSTIYMYYGNSSVATTSNGKNTFVIYDNLESGTIDTNIWELKQSFGSVGIKTDGVPEGTYAVGIYQGSAQGNGTVDQDHFFVKLTDSSDLGYRVLLKTKRWYVTSYWGHFVGFGMRGTELVDTTYNDSTISTYETLIKRVNSTTVSVVVNKNGAFYYTNASLGMALGSTLTFGIQTRHNGAGDNSIQIRGDALKVCKYVTTEPTYAVGAEQLL